MTDEDAFPAEDENDRFAVLFQIGRDERKKLFTDPMQLRLGALKETDRARFEELTEKYRDIKMRDVPAIEKYAEEGRRKVTKELMKAQANRLRDRVEGRMLPPDDPRFMAQAFFDDARPNLIWSNGTWWDWNGAAYREVEIEALRSGIYEYLPQCINALAKEPEPLKPTASMVSNVLDALNGLCYRDYTELVAPCWLDPEPSDPNPYECLSLTNGVLHVPTRTLIPNTPRFFTYNSVDYPYIDALEAPPPKHWLDMMDRTWGDTTPDSIRALQEAMGYLLTPDTKFQKIIKLIGPTRSGKGTVGKVITCLVGEDNVDASMLSELDNKSFGMESMVGKSTLLVTDMRTAPGNSGAVVENLLRISGEDRVSVARKFRKNWQGILRIRIVILANFALVVADQANAITTRLIPMRMTKSFAGHEDIHLYENKLRPAMSSILNWALDGYDRLAKRGKFLLSPDGEAVIREMEMKTNPVKFWLAECCELDPTATVPTKDAYHTFEMWQALNEGAPKDASAFGRMLASASNYTVEVYRPRVGEDGGQVRTYTGLRVKAEWLERAKTWGGAEFDEP